MASDSKMMQAKAIERLREIAKKTTEELESVSRFSLFIQKVRELVSA